MSDASQSNGPSGDSGDRPAEEPAAVAFYVGAYTVRGSRGIYRFQVDRETGKLGGGTLVAEKANPSFLALDPAGRRLFSTGDVEDPAGGRVAAVSAWAIDSTRGGLSPLGSAIAGGTGLCHVALDPSGRIVLGADYGGGRLVAFPIRADGAPGERSCVIRHEGKGSDPERQAGPHVHSATPDPAGRFVLAADLGIDKICIYRLDAENGLLEEHGSANLASGAGPRHLAFHPNGGHVYVINELNSTVSVFEYDATRGSLSERQNISCLPDDFSGESYTAEVAVHPSGRFLYGSNRGHDSLAIFAIEESGALSWQGTVPTRGQHPRHFAVDPSGRFLVVANMHSDTIVSFRIDEMSGALEPADETGGIGSPSCLCFFEGKTDCEVQTSRPMPPPD